MNGRLMAIGKAKSRQKFEIFEIDNKTDVEAEEKNVVTRTTISVRFSEFFLLMLFIIIIKVASWKVKIKGTDPGEVDSYH